MRLKLSSSKRVWNVLSRVPVNITLKRWSLQIVKRSNISIKKMTSLWRGWSLNRLFIFQWLALRLSKVISLPLRYITRKSVIYIMRRRLQLINRLKKIYVVHNLIDVNRCHEYWIIFVLYKNFSNIIYLKMGNK